MSKDNTCPTCGNTAPIWNDKRICITCARDRVLGSGQQEDKPTNDFGDFFRNAPQEEQEKLIREVVKESNADQKALTDSKPEKPQYWACYDHALSTGEADGRCAGCRAVHVPADYRPGNTTEPKPKEPDQLADILLELTGSTPSRNYAVSLAYKRLKAFLATEYDRGQADKALEQAQKREKHMATAYDRGVQDERQRTAKLSKAAVEVMNSTAEYDRGKVDGRKEVINDLKQNPVGNVALRYILTQRQYSKYADYLKSKGESK